MTNYSAVPRRCSLRVGLLACVTLAASSGSSPSSIPEVYTVDQAHSLLDFTVRLVALNRVRGTFADWRADFTYDPADPARSSVTFFADVASINTEVEERDEHLKGPDFFDAEKFPRIRFQSTSVTPNSNGVEVEGDLTIRDVTRRIRFPAELLFPEQRDPFGNRRIVFGAKLTLNRRDYGVNGPRFWSTAIADNVTIEMEIAGRIWEYSRVNFGRTDAVIGPRLLAAADSGKLEGALQQVRGELAADSTRFPTAFELRTAAMRLFQKQKLAEARLILEFGETVAGHRWPAGPHSVNLTSLAEVLFRGGDTPGARTRIAQALALDGNNTQAMEWQRLMGPVR
jgi:polyisoprenoid-binding protein YceI